MTTSSPVAPSFRLEREGIELAFRLTTLVEREWLNPDYVRVRVQSDELVGFGRASAHDDHVRIFIPETVPESVEQLRAAPSREFTPLRWGEDWLDLEFAVHGDEGVAGVWAATAPLGAPLGVGGPRGTLRIDGAPGSWFLAGDETAIPQVRRYAALIPEGAPARVLVEVADAAHEVAIDAPVPIEYVHRDGAAPTTALSSRLAALGTDDRPAGDVFAFVAAEQQVVKTARALLVDRWGIEPERFVVKGYWKSDETGSTYHAAH